MDRFDCCKHFTFPPVSIPPSVHPPPPGGGNRDRLVPKKNTTVSYCTGLQKWFGQSLLGELGNGSPPGGGGGTVVPEGGMDMEGGRYVKHVSALLRVLFPTRLAMCLSPRAICTYAWPNQYEEYQTRCVYWGCSVDRFSQFRAYCVQLGAQKLSQYACALFFCLCPVLCSVPCLLQTSVPLSP